MNWRNLLARLPLPMLALSASYGVFQFSSYYVPSWVALIQAAAFECTYVGLAVTIGLASEERRRATAISVGAVVVSITYNTLAGLFHRNPAWLVAMPWYGEVLGAVLHGAPLAWVAYLVADLLLHSRAAPAGSARQTETLTDMSIVALQAYDETTTTSVKQEYRCPRCRSALNLGAYGAAKRHGHCSSCDGSQGQGPWASRGCRPSPMP